MKILVTYADSNLNVKDIGARVLEELGKQFKDSEVKFIQGTTKEAQNELEYQVDIEGYKWNKAALLASIMGGILSEAEENYITALDAFLIDDSVDD